MDSALDKYIAVTEALFSSWTQRQLNTRRLWRGLSAQHCPEPYLTFSPGRSPLIWLTHNPGRPLKFQHIDRLQSANAVIKSNTSYAENSKALANHYQLNPDKDMTSASRVRLKGMLDFSRSFSFDGLIQVELFPLHSEHRPPDAYLFGDDRIEKPFDAYRSAVRQLVDSAPLVIAICGSKPDTSSETVRLWLNCLVLDARAISKPLLLNHNGTVGAFIARSNKGGCRVLICRQGSNGLPAKKTWTNLIKAINSA